MPVTTVTLPADQAVGSCPSHAYNTFTRVRIPAHIWRHPDLTAADKITWAKVAKLDKPGPGRPGGGCTLSATELARQLDLAPGTVKASLRKLERLKLMHVRQRVTKFGRQASVRFALRQGDIDGPLFADVPVGLVDELRGHELPVLCELMMRLHTGRLIDTVALTEAVGIKRGALTQCLTRLASRGLVEVVERGGRQGRHQYKARWSPADPWLLSEPGPKGVENRPWATPDDLPSATPDDLPAHRKESFEADSEADPPLRSGEAAAVGDAREGASGAPKAATTVEPAPAAEPPPAGGLRPERKTAATRKTGVRPRPKPAARKPHGLTLEAVRTLVVPHAGADLLARLSPWQRRELERRLALAVEDDPDLPVVRMSHRLRNAINRTSGCGVADAFGWLVTVATRRQGCGNPMCEDGLIWDLRTACPACRERAIDRAADKRRAAAVPPGEGAPPPAATPMPPPCSDGSSKLTVSSTDSSPGAEKFRQARARLADNRG